MYYDPGTSSATVQNPSFVPMLTPNFTSNAARQLAEQLCGSNVQCQLDYAVTGNNALAGATVEIAQSVNTTNQKFSKLHLLHIG